MGVIIIRDQQRRFKNPRLYRLEFYIRRQRRREFRVDFLKGKAEFAAEGAPFVCSEVVMLEEEEERGRA